MHIKGLLFDLDGVILDTFREGMRRIRICAAMHDIAFTRETREKLFQLWGIPGADLMRQALGINKRLAERIYTDWEKFDKTDPPQMVPGAREVLVWARKEGFEKALITSRNRTSLDDVLDHLDLTHEFRIVTSRNDTPYHKPDPRVFRFALETLKESCGIEPTECVFVGDTPSDLLAGQSAGLTTLIVQTGPFLIEHIATHPMPPQNILRSVDDLPLWIEKHHEGKLINLY